MMINKGELVGKHRIHKKLGNGAYGEVYLANHELLNRSDAVKIIEVKNPAEFKEHLEARILLKCKHDNVVDIHDVDIVEINNKYHVSISMEYMDLGSVLNCMEDAPLSIKKSLLICINILFALENAHQNDVLHRDVKPENIMIDTKTGAKLSDFGVAAIIDESGEGSAKGSPVFRAPETFSKNITNHETEVFSVGMSLFQMICHILDWDMHFKNTRQLQKAKQ